MPRPSVRLPKPPPGHQMSITALWSGSDGVVQIDACAESLQEQLVAAGNSSAKGVAEEIAKSRVATERARERCVPTPNPLLLSTVSSPVIVCV